MTGWALSTIPQIREIVKVKLKGPHDTIIKAVITKLCAQKVEINMGGIIDTYLN